MIPWTPDIADIVSGIVTLAARGGEELVAHRVHAALFDLKAKHPPILSALTFSITGSLFYSKQIEDTIRTLAARGLLRAQGKSFVVVDGAPAKIRERVSRRFPRTVYHRVLSASVALHRSLRGLPARNERPEQKTC